MATAHDVAKYILEVHGPMSAMKLEKLVYYSQAWSLVWDERPMFSERIEAWRNGPVVPDLYDVHRGEYAIQVWPHGDTSNIDQVAKDTIDVVLEYYGKHNAQTLSDITHAEEPWQIARRGLDPSKRGSRLISLASMSEFYSSLAANDEQVQ